MGPRRVVGIDEDNLVRRWIGGDQLAAQQLIVQHKPELNRFFRARQCADADDLVQETLLAVMESRTRFRGDASFRTYVLRIARYKLWAYRRHRRRSHVAWEEVENELEIQTRSIEQAPRRDDLDEALTQLAPALVHIVVLSFERKLSRDAIARQLGIPAGTVASRLRSAKMQLRQLLVTGALSSQPALQLHL